MTATRILTALTLSLSFLNLCPAFGASLRDNTAAAPTAVARIAGGDYCFARIHRFNPERQPPDWIEMKLRIQVAYHNAGARPLIIPTEHERVVYTTLKPGVMNVYKEMPSIETLNPAIKAMTALPPKVSLDNPVDPKNDAFVVVPARGDLVSSTFEDIAFPVNHKLVFRHDPDLRGKKLYIRLVLSLQEMNPSLVSELADRWNKFGVLWTGSVMTNVMTIEVPRNPAPSGVCSDGPFETPANTPPDTGK